MSADLKACPFCGGEARFCQTFADNPYRGWVRCETCHASATVRLDRIAAIDAWNRRTVAEADPAEFELFCDHELVAGVAGRRAQVLAEILHYATVYGQDGDVRIEEITRTLVPLPAAPEATS